MRRCTRILPVVLALAATAEAVAQPQAEGPLAEALEKRVDLDFEVASVERVLKHLEGAVAGLAFEIDPALKNTGRDLADCVVSLRLKQVPVREVLWLLSQLDLGFVPRPSGVLVTPRDRACTLLVCRTYPVAGLLEVLRRPGAWKRAPDEVWPRPAAEDAPDTWAQRLAVLIRKVTYSAWHTEAAPWKTWGGSATTHVASNVLVVEQSPSGHTFIAAFLSALEEAFEIVSREAAKDDPAAQQPVVTVTMRDPLAEETRCRLQRPISVRFYRTSFPDALKLLESYCPGITFVEDPALSFVGLDLSSRVLSFQVTEVPAEEALALIVGQDLAYVVRPGYVLITTREKLQANLPLGLYPVEDLLRALEKREGSAADPASERPAPRPGSVITRTVNNQQDPNVAAWTDEGGPAVVDCLGGVLVVTQTVEGHARLLDLLTRLRGALSAAFGTAAAPKPEEEVDPYVARVRERLERPIDVAFHGMPAADALDRVAAAADLGIITDPSVCTEGHDMGEHRVELTARAMPVARVVEAILPKGLTYRAKRGYLHILSLEKHEQHLGLEVYPIADLLRTGVAAEGVGASPAPGARAFAEDVCRTMPVVADHEICPRVASWSDEGGRAACEPLGGAMILVQTPDGQAQVARALKALRAILVDGASEPQAISPPPNEHSLAAEKACRDRLARPITCDFKNVWLNKALDYVADFGGVPIRIDASIANEHKHPEDHRVTMLAEDVPVSEALDRMLPKEFAWCVEGDHVTVMTRWGFLSRTHARFYPISDLWKGMPSPSRVEAAAEDLVEAIQKKVAWKDAPDVTPWAEDGGPGRLWVCGGALLVRQTEAGHRRVAAFLERLRRPAPAP